MTCFDNFIGILEACEGDTMPDSGLFIDQDLGITVDELNSLVDSNQENGIDLFKVKQALAVKEVTNEIYTHIRSAFRAKSIIDGDRIGIEQENLVFQDGGDERGIELKICNDNSYSSANGNSYLSLYISEISLQLDTSGAVNVEVWDLLTNTLLDTIPITAVANQITAVTINKTYKANRRDLHLAFLYDATGKKSNRTFLRSSGCKTCGSGAIKAINAFICTRGVKIDAAAAKLDKNLQGVGHTSGMSVVYSLNCDHENYLCSIRNLLGLPILYKTALGIANYAMHNTHQINENTVEFQQRWADRAEFYNMEYTSKLDNILTNLRLPKDARCFECDAVIRYRPAAMI